MRNINFQIENKKGQKEQKMADLSIKEPLYRPVFEWIFICLILFSKLNPSQENKHPFFQIK